MQFDPSQLEMRQMYKLLTGAVAPRPIAWVSTTSQEGILNLAPYSLFTVASRKPPMLCFSVGVGVEGRAGTEKDTLVNIREQKEFVINIVSSHLGNQMQKTAENWPSDVNEFEKAGVTPIKSTIVKPMRVKESPIQMECRLHQIIQLGTDHLVIGEMVHYHIQDEYYLGDFKVDLQKLSAIGRYAGNYGVATDFFTLPR